MDDTILLCESPEDLQKMLNLLHKYGDRWKLQINSSKTKIMTFSKGMCDTEAKMPTTIRKTMKTINMRARHVSITAVISSGALSVKTKKY